MILSVSRRTDIPAYYSEWFLHRIREGFVYVQNPMNPRQISRIDLSPDVVDCIVFWTKNPAPMLDRLKELKNYQYYFQYTLTGYGKDIEPNVPHKRDVMIPTFRRLSEQIGSNRVIWRYDPIIFTKIYTSEYHLKAFEQISTALCGYTNRCVISFVDMYAKIKKNMDAIESYELSECELLDFAKEIARIANANGITVASCAERIDLSSCGIVYSCCIDKKLIEDMIGCRIEAHKDKNQRSECGCIESVDIGTYNTCMNGCKYCYANYSQASVLEHCKNYDTKSPLLRSTVKEDDNVPVRPVKSLKIAQMSFL